MHDDVLVDYDANGDECASVSVDDVDDGGRVAIATRCTCGAAVIDDDTDLKDDVDYDDSCEK